MTVHFVMLPMEGGHSHVAVDPGLVRCDPEITGR
jgi:hypothetical protein